MKLKKNLIVSIEANGELAEIVFNAPKANKIMMFFGEYKDISEKSPEELKKTYSLVLNEIVEVRGVTWDDNKPVTKEDVLAFEVPMTLINGIVAGYIKLVSGADEDPKPVKAEDDSLIA